MHEADLHLRQFQQGYGRPIIGAKIADQQIVAVGKTIYSSRNWKTFPDFLDDYIKKKLKADWGNTEIAKPLNQRHPIMQWYDAYARYQQSVIVPVGQPRSYEIIGVVACYLGLSYALYLLDHNVELQDRLISRLRNTSNFQGAYYELIVASILLRAGFRLILEDETDPTTKHCEFAAISPKTGKRYWVEAKMRSVSGILGKTSADGGPDLDPLSRLIPHLNSALKKPALNERLIFIDLNADPTVGAEEKPTWLEPAVARLEKFEKNELSANQTAYVFVTNFAFHRQLDAAPSIAAIPIGLGIFDFNRPGQISLSDAYLQKRKHIDAHLIGDAINGYLRFPSTFDGKPPSEAFRQSSRRIKVGESYIFPNEEGGEFVGVVSDVLVKVEEKELMIAVNSVQGQGRILKAPMSDLEVEEYKEFGDSYFGKAMQSNRKANDPFALFEMLMSSYSTIPRDKLINLLSISTESHLHELSDEELRLIYCERIALAIIHGDRGTS